MYRMYVIQKNGKEVVSDRKREGDFKAISKNLYFTMLHFKKLGWDIEGLTSLKACEKIVSQVKTGKPVMVHKGLRYVIEYNPKN